MFILFSELLESISLDSREFRHEILSNIEQSFKDKDATKSFKYTRARLVHNGELSAAVSLGHFAFWIWLNVKCLLLVFQVTHVFFIYDLFWNEKKAKIRRKEGY